MMMKMTMMIVSNTRSERSRHCSCNLLLLLLDDNDDLMCNIFQKLTLSPCITELLEKLGAKILEIGQQLTLERRAKRKNIASFNKVADLDNKKGKLNGYSTVLIITIRTSCDDD